MKSEWIYGVHAIQAVLDNNPTRFIEVYVDTEKGHDKRFTPLINTFAQLNIRVQWAQKKTLEKQANTDRHQGIVAKVQSLPVKTENELEQIIAQHDAPLLLILDGVTDPHNLGACLRTADGAGVCAVIVPKDRSAGLNSTVSKVASGGAESVPLIQVTNLARTMEWLKSQNIWLVGTTGDTDKTIYEAQWQSGGLGIVMGAEGEGMRHLTMQKCDELVKIPMMGKVSSLNVSVATGVCLYEALRARQTHKK